MTDQRQPPDGEDENAMGVAPEEESGAGYGNHAPDAGENAEKPRPDDD